MIDQINELPEDGLKSSPETSRYIENTWFSRKIKISCTFLHLIDILNDLILIGLTDGSTGYERSLISLFLQVEIINIPKKTKTNCQSKNLNLNLKVCSS